MVHILLTLTVMLIVRKEEIQRTRFKYLLLPKTVNEVPKDKIYTLSIDFRLHVPKIA